MRGDVRGQALGPNAYAAASKTDLITDSTDSESSSDDNAKDAMLVELEETTYGALLYSLCRITESKSLKSIGGKTLACKAGYAFLIHAVAVAAGLGAMFLLYSSSIELKADKYEAGFGDVRDALSHALDTGVRANTTAAGQRAERLCYATHTFPYTHTFAVFVFFTKMAPELTDAVLLFTIILGIRSGSRTVFKFSADVHVVEQMTVCAKALSIIFVPVLKLIVVLTVGFIGAKQITLQTTTAKIVLQMVSLQFILLMDEMFYAAFYGRPFKHEVKTSRFSTNPFGVRHKCCMEAIGPVKFVIILVIAVLFDQGLFLPLHQFRVGCHAYKAEFPDPDWNDAHGYHLFGLYISV